MPLVGKTIIYSCPFVPAEWIEAYGFTPSRAAKQISGILAGLAPGVCPYASAFASYAAISDAAGVVVTTVCDQMRRSADVISRKNSIPVFLMNVPHTWQSEAAQELYLSELERLGRFLVDVGGSKPSDERLVETMLRYDSMRSKVRNKPQTASGIPIALTGGPLPDDSSGFIRMIERAGGYIALDGTETGIRTLPAPLDRTRINDPVGLLADSYFGSIPDPFRRPNSGFYEWLNRSLNESGARGLILRRYVWCDTWHAEAERIRKEIEIPFLHLDFGDDGADARILTRLQSFMEMLK